MSRLQNLVKIFLAGVPSCLPEVKMVTYNGRMAEVGF